MEDHDKNPQAPTAGLASQPEVNPIPSRHRSNDRSLLPELIPAKFYQWISRRINSAIGNEAKQKSLDAQQLATNKISLYRGLALNEMIKSSVILTMETGTMDIYRDTKLSTLA